MICSIVRIRFPYIYIYIYSISDAVYRIFRTVGDTTQPYHESCPNHLVSMFLVRQQSPPNRYIVTYIHSHVIQRTPLPVFQWPITSSTYQVTKKQKPCDQMFDTGSNP